MIIGFSTGCLYKTHERISKETIAVLRSAGANAIEFACADHDELEKLISEIEVDDVRDFEYVSLHASTILGVKTLELLQSAHDKFNFNAIVIHPDEVENWEIFSAFSFPFVIENMDWRKEFGKYADSMQAIFEKIDAPMVLDLNHCYTNDPTMQLAKDMAMNFGGRIAEFHISGFDHLHEPLFQTKQTEIIDAIFDKKLPIIIESGCETVEDAKKEIEYIKTYLQ